MRRRRLAGFTIIETIVATTIAAGALMLISSTCLNASQRALNSVQRERLDVAATSKLGEIALGLENNVMGEFKNIGGWRWQISRQSAGLVGLDNVIRMMLTVTTNDGSMSKVYSLLVLEPREVSK